MPYLDDQNTFVVTAWWALDFSRAIYNMNWLRRILFRIVIGKYAYREFAGIMQTLHSGKYDPGYPYELENVDYNKEKLSLDLRKVNLDYYKIKEDKNKVLL